MMMTSTKITALNAYLLCVTLSVPAQAQDTMTADPLTVCTAQAQSLTRGAIAWKSSFDATGTAADSTYISELLMAFDVNTAYETALRALYIGDTDKGAVFDQLDHTLTQLQFKRGLIVAMLDEAFAGSTDTARQQDFISSCVAQFSQ